MKSAPRGNRGFALLEVVVALTITALLLVVVYNAVHLGLRAEREVVAAVHDNDGTRAFTYFLRRQLRHVDTAVMDKRLRFSGDRHHLRCALRGFRGDPSTYLLELRAVPAGDPKTLVASIQRVDTGSRASTPPVLQSRIGGNLKGVRFEFYGNDPRAGDGLTGAVWRESWRGASRPPQLVRIRYFQTGRGEENLFLAVAGADGNQVADYASAGAGR